ncbi:hypothetical protein C7S15_7764 [Burkholderia cepacia]|nr:hypothetical protein [Burkholderia cepacia]
MPRSGIAAGFPAVIPDAIAAMTRWASRYRMVGNRGAARDIPGRDATGEPCRL